MSQMELQQDELNRRKKWTAIFVSSIVVFTFLCIGVLYSKYDSLTRYPYKDEKSRKLIKEYLNRDEMEYIIEYSIAPNMFVSFIQEDQFNIYHAESYKKLSQSQWEKSPEQIVKMVEETQGVYTVDQLAQLLAQGNYEYQTIHAFLQEGDPYFAGGQLVDDPMREDVYLNERRGIKDRKPIDLVALDPSIPSFDQNLQISSRIQEPLMRMLQDIQLDYGSEVFGANLQVKHAYIPYEVQVKRFEAEEEKKMDYAGLSIERPGHSEHQLGLAIDFAIDGLLDEDFGKSIQYKWLKENAYKYGFVETYTPGTVELTGQLEKPYHFRFVGYDLAWHLHEHNISFASYADSKLYE